MYLIKCLAELQKAPHEDFDVCLAKSLFVLNFHEKGGRGGV